MPTYQLLTDRTLAQASAITPTTLIHIVYTGDPSQNIAGSSYKAELQQLSSIFSGGTDTLVTGGTYSAGTITFTNSSGGTFPVTGLTEPFTGGSGNCIADLYVSNIHSCSPLNINPLDEGNVYFGSTSGVTVDVSNVRVGIGTDSPTELLHLKSTGAVRVKLEADTDNLDETHNVQLLLSQDGGVSTAVFGITPDTNNNLVVGVNSNTTPNIHFGTRNDGTSFVTTADTKMIITNVGNVGIGTTNPQFFIDIISGTSRAYFNTTSAGGIYVVSGSTNIPRFGTVISSYLTKPSASTTIGMRTWNDTTWPGYGKVGDFFIRSSAESNGLNIIKADGVGTEDYVRFFAGRDSNGYISDMFIQGSGLTRGYVGISTEDPQEKLHVSGNTIISGTLNIGTIGGGTPLINLGLDVTGTVVTGTTGGGTFTGGTVNGATNFTNGLTANTMSASTLFVNGVQITGDTFVTGGTYSAGTITFTNNQNGQFPVTGLTEPFTGGSGNCIADLYVTNIHGCSPITIYDSIKSTGSTVLGQTSISFGFQTSATTDYSHAEGSQTLASGQGSHAEGSQTSATTIYSHTEGVGTITLGDYSHSEGWYNISSGFASHSEGNITTSSGNYSHSEGSFTDSSGFSSHAEGGSSQSIGDYSHAEGVNTIVSIFGAYAHAEGAYTLATGQGSHSEGYYTTTNGYYSHAEGTGTTANGFASHSEGDNTIAYEDFQKVMGKYNTTGNTNQLFIIGRGTSISRANALRVSSNGNLNIAGTLTQSSADYAEYFESIDGNSYPYGTVVELENDKIKICTNADNAIGVISSKPAIVGNADDGTEDEWVGKYEKDIWGNFITEDYTYQVPIGLDSENNTIYKTVTDKRQKINKNYDETRTYIPRSERPEWNVVGLLGQIRVLKNQQIPNRWIKMKDINDDIAIYLVR